MQKARKVRYIESPEGYKIGYSNGTGDLVNTFPSGSARYDIIDPYENYYPYDGGIVPQGELYQVITIWNRPGGQTVNAKAIGTGVGSYTFSINEKIWKNNNLQDAFTPIVHTGTFIPGYVDAITIPINNRESGAVYTESTQAPPPSPPPANSSNCLKVNQLYTLIATGNSSWVVDGFRVYWDYDNDPNYYTSYTNLNNPTHIYTRPGKKHIKVQAIVCSYCFWTSDNWWSQYDKYITISGGLSGGILNLLLDD